MARGLSAGASSGGTTPRAAPLALASESKALDKAMEARQERIRAQQQEREPTLPEYTKGKEREQTMPNGDVVHAPAPVAESAPTMVPVPVVPAVYTAPAPQDGYFVNPPPVQAAVPAPLTMPMLPFVQPTGPVQQ